MRLRRADLLLPAPRPSLLWLSVALTGWTNAHVTTQPVLGGGHPRSATQQGAGGFAGAQWSHAGVCPAMPAVLSSGREGRCVKGWPEGASSHLPHTPTGKLCASSRL